MAASESDYPTYASNLIDRLRHPHAWLCVLLVVLLPNILFLVVSPWLIIRRALSPVLYLVAALLTLVLPSAFAYPLFLLASAIDGFFIVSLMFGMPFDLALASLKFLADIDVGASILYLSGMSALFAIAVISAFFVNRYRHHLRTASFVPAAIATLALVWIDYATNVYNPSKPTIFQSALQQAGMSPGNIVRNNRNVLLVLVEGMGAYTDPRERDLMESKLRAIAGTRYKLTHGVNTHYGSTSGAISRELCGQWGTFTTYLDGEDHDCLPAKLARAGFETISYDGFTGDLLSFRDWYPRIGIQTLNFRDDMERDHPSDVARHCGTALRGLCDDDVGRLVHRELAMTDGSRKFVYWLTLNSHLPYAPLKNGPLHCATARAVIANRATCELTEIWMDVFDTIASIAADERIPPVDIMVVGDHNTPMWSRAAANHFREGLVDWYRLEFVGGARLNGDS